MPSSPLPHPLDRRFRGLWHQRGRPSHQRGRPSGALDDRGAGTRREPRSPLPRGRAARRRFLVGRRRCGRPSRAAGALARVRSRIRMAGASRNAPPGWTLPAHRALRRSRAECAATLCIVVSSAAAAARRSCGLADGAAGMRAPLKAAAAAALAVQPSWRRKRGKGLSAALHCGPGGADGAPPPRSRQLSECQTIRSVGAAPRTPSRREHSKNGKK